MKKTVIFIAATCFALSLQAASGDSTLEVFLSAQKQQAEGKSWKYNEAKSKKIFQAMDADGNGVASSAEKQAYWASKGKKKKPSAKVKAPAPKPVVKKNVKGQTLEKFHAEQKAKSAKKGWTFKANKSEAIFNEMDANNDGILTGAEKSAYWKKKGH